MSYYEAKCPIRLHTFLGNATQKVICLSANANTILFWAGNGRFAKKL